MDVKTVAALLGDTVTTVINTYIHYSDEMRQNAKKISKEFLTKLINFCRFSDEY